MKARLEAEREHQEEIRRLLRKEEVEAAVLEEQTRQAIIDDLAKSSEPARSIVSRRRAAHAAAKRDALAEELLAQVPSLRRLKQPAKAGAAVSTGELHWITEPLDTVPAIPKAPSVAEVEQLLASARYLPFSVDGRMAAGGCTVQLLAMQALTAALADVHLCK